MRSAGCIRKTLLLAILVLTIVAAVLAGPAQADVALAWTYPTLQAAINACALYGGGTVVADAITYNENIFIDSPNLLLQGQGKSTIIAGGGDGHAVTVTGSKVKIADLQVYAPGSNNDGIYCTGSECEFEKVYVSGAGRYGLNIGGVDEYGSIVSDCVVENTFASALLAEQSRMRVSGCSLGQPTRTDVATATVLSTGNYNIFTNNFIEQGSVHSQGVAESIILDSGISNVATGNVLMSGYFATPESGHVVGVNSESLPADPVTIYISDMHDNVLIGGSWYANFNYGDAQAIAAGGGPSIENAERIPIYRASLSGIAPGSTIEEVIFGFYTSATVGGGVTVTVYPISAENDGWMEGTENGVTQYGSSCFNDLSFCSITEWTNGPTWKTSGNWINTSFGTADCTTTGIKMISFNISGIAAVQAALSAGDGDFEFCLIANSYAINVRSVFNSSEFATSSERPFLQVTYTPPSGWTE